MKYIYLIYDCDGMIRQTKSRVEASYWCKNRPDWSVVKKSIPVVKIVYEDAPF